MSTWIEGTVVNLRQWTDELYSVQVEADVAPFTAGQFTRVALEIDGEMVARPYSFVNGPDNPLHEFYFILVKDGPLTHELIKLKRGDSAVSGAEGLPVSSSSANCLKPTPCGCWRPAPRWAHSCRS